MHKAGDFELFFERYETSMRIWEEQDNNNHLDLDGNGNKILTSEDLDIHDIHHRIGDPGYEEALAECNRLEAEDDCRRSGE